MNSTIDSTQAETRYFLPYQLDWIRDDSMLRGAEKSVRIGWTFGDAFKNVRKRLHHAKRDYLFQTKDESTAIEYVQVCYQHAEIFKVTKSVLSRSVEEMKVPRFNEDGKDTGLVDEVKVGRIVFDNGSRILAFSSNPNAMRAFGGDVGLDEFAFHRQPDALWASAAGRTTWGFDLGMWSSHNGEGTLFNEMMEEAKAGKNKWSHYRVTMVDAIAQGLVEKINAVSGKNKSREEFLADCRARARSQAAFDQEYMCIPSSDATAFIPRDLVRRCRSHEGTPWEYSLEEAGRCRNPLFGGLDIGRHHDFTSFTVTERVGDIRIVRRRIDLQNMPFSEQERVLYPWFKVCQSTAIDKNGLGEHLAERATERFGRAKIEPYAFTAASKEALAYITRTHFEDGTVRLPNSPLDAELEDDIAAIRRSTSPGGAVKFEADRGKNGHADRFWSLALSLYAGNTAREVPLPGRLRGAAGRTTWAQRARRERRVA